MNASRSLTVIKRVINDNGGAAVASDFEITVSGNMPSPATFSGDASGTDVALGAGPFEVSADDAENWANVVDGLSGPMASDMDLYVGLGMGTEKTDPDLPGIHAHPLSEAGHRAFYLRWRAQLAASIGS